MRAALQADVLPACVGVCITVDARGFLLQLDSSLQGVATRFGRVSPPHQPNKLRDRQRSLADASPVLHVSHSSMHRVQAVVDTALGRAEAELSNATSMAAGSHAVVSVWRASVH